MGEKQLKYDVFWLFLSLKRVFLGKKQAKNGCKNVVFGIKKAVFWVKKCFKCTRCFTCFAETVYKNPKLIIGKFAKKSMDEYNKEIAEIGAKNAVEITGNLMDYYKIIQRPNDSYKIVWEKKASTHIKHKVTAVVKKYFIPTF